MSDNESMTRSPNGGTRPVPDPTVLTTEQLLREIANVRLTLTDKIADVTKLLESRIESAEKNNNIRFNGIERDFGAIEAWRKEQKIDTKTAVDAALAAAEKAVRDQTLASEKAIAKSETSSNEQGKQQYATFTASLKGVSDTLSDVKDRFLKVEAVALQVTALIESGNAMRDRIGALEAEKRGAVETRTTQRLDLGSIIAVVGVAILVLTFVLTRTK